MVAPVALRVLEREALVFRRLWRGSIGQAVVIPALFLSALGLGLGGLVDEGTGQVEGLEYLDFVVPGLLVTSIVGVAVGASLWQVMGGLKWFRNFHAVVASPASAADLYVGYVAWTGVRIVLSATAYLAVAVAFGGVPSWWGVLALPAALLCGLAVAAPLTAYAATQEGDETFPLILRLWMMPVGLFSGAFFPIEQLPGWLRPAIVVFPIWHGIELCRGATSGAIDGGAAGVHVAVLSAYIAAGTWWGRRTFARRLTP